MKGSDVLRSAFKDVTTARPEDCIVAAGAKAEAELARIAAERAANFMVVVVSILSRVQGEIWIATSPSSRCVRDPWVRRNARPCRTYVARLKDRGFAVQQDVCLPVLQFVTHISGVQ
jgi:hypothetical protein